MDKVAVTLVLVGAALAWAYYAPRVLATVRLVRDRRNAQAAQVSRLERVGAGHTRTDRAFETIVRELDATDRTWARGVREASARARTASRWVSLNVNRRDKRGGAALPPDRYLNK